MTKGLVETRRPRN